MFAEGALVNRKYRILTELGQGSLGLSYKALVLGSNSVCAIKVLDDSLVPSQIPRDLVEQAVLKSSELRHSGVLRWQTVETGTSGETILVRDFVEGASLRSLMIEGKPFAVPRASHIVRQIALVLDAANRMKMFHGDLRPENILLCDPGGDEQARVLDFGMARLRENFTYSLHKLTLKDPGPLMGDPRYLSPEQAAGLQADSLDSRSDIYSLGIIFCQLLTGHLPCPSNSPLESLMWHVLGAPPDLLECYSDLKIPEDLNHLIRLMLAKPRDKRVESARKVIEKLELFEGQHRRVRAKAIEVPSFGLLSDRNKARPAGKSLEAPAPKPKRVTEAKPTLESPKVPSALEIPAPVLPVGAVEIAPVQPTILNTMKSTQSRRRSRRGWGIAAAILIVVVGLGTADYHFRSRIPWTAAARLSQARLQTWGHGLAAGLHTSSRKIEKGLQSWSRTVEAQLSLRRKSSVSVAAQVANSAAPPPVVAQASNAPTGTAATPARNAAQSRNRTPTNAGQATPIANSGGALAVPNKTPPPTPESKETRAANESNRPPVESNSPAAKAPRRPRQENAMAVSNQPSAPTRLDTATVARMIGRDLRNGDSLFEMGEYDHAINLYKQGLALDPANKALLDRIARAKRAQAAEAEYLNQ
ncbi:MAG: protein kinase domain-containing protein [Terriglobia bacterium]